MDISCIMNRRSVRKYTNEPVSDEDIRTLLTAGMYAPSAQNSQPWEFLVVKDKELLRQLSHASHYWTMLKHAPLAIVVLANLEDYRASNQSFFIQDCAGCTLNILNAACGMGLGGVWLGLYGVEERMQQVADLLHIPNSIHPFSVLSLGHPASVPAAHDFYHEQKVHYETYK